MTTNDRELTSADTSGVPVPPAPPSKVRTGSLLKGLVRTARPRQWTKNLLVFAAPGAAGVLTQVDEVARAGVAFVLFCVAASGAYFLNDASDVVADRNDPLKQHRPIAAGTVTVGLAKVVGPALMAISVVGAFLLAGWPLAIVFAIYVVMQPLYSLWLKHLVVIDLAAVASGFLLRAIAGGVAVDVPISKWFLIVASFGSLFMVAGKRQPEHLDLGEMHDYRTTRRMYSADYLRYVRSLSSSVAIAAYCLWAFEKADLAAAPIWFQLSIVPFVLAILRYALLLDTGLGGAPEEIVLQDRALQVLGGVWVLTFAVGIYAS